MRARFRTTPVLLVLLAAAGLSACTLRQRLSLYLPSRAVNARGGDLTIRNARIWTGDPQQPWANALTVRNGRIASMDADKPAGRVYDLQGRLVVPGLWDAHAHPQAPYVLFSPEAPTLFGCKTAEEVLDRVRQYCAAHPEDKFPRFFGWMDDVFPDGRKPTRHMLDSIVSNRPVYLVHNGGHAHWVNTRALELAGALEHDPPGLKGDGRIHRDPDTGLATGFIEETEYAATHGLMLNAFKKVRPYSLEEMALLQRAVLEEYPKAGVTAVWTKDGDADITRIYERIYRDNALPVRAVLDTMFTYYSVIEDLDAIAARAREMERAGVDRDFLRADVVKLYIDLPEKGWKWMFAPYADNPADSGKPAYPLEFFQQQMDRADCLGLQINVSVYGDRALHECFNAFAKTYRANPPRPRRHSVEHGEYVQDADLPRFRELDVTASMNPDVSYPWPAYRDMLYESIGADRLEHTYQRYRELVDAGARVVNGSDYPLFPMDPLLGMHTIVTGTDLHGQPPGGVWPHKRLTIEEALRTYTTAPAEAAFMEDRLGKLLPGYHADFVALSEDILAPDFEPLRLAGVKAALTVLNGHVLHRDFSNKPKVITFLN
jgi:predicted amidohydrolase YtcJ